MEENLSLLFNAKREFYFTHCTEAGTMCYASVRILNEEILGQLGLLTLIPLKESSCSACYFTKFLNIASKI